MRTCLPRFVLSIILISAMFSGIAIGSESPEHGCGGVVFLDHLPLTAPERSSLEAVTSFLYLLWTPRVLEARDTGPVTLTVVVDGSPTSVEILPRDGGAAIPVLPIAPGVFEITLPADDLLNGYLMGTGRHRT